MINALKRLIRWARVTAAGTDSEQFPVQQIEYMGKTADCMIVFPYGIHGNVPADGLALIFAVQGDDSNRAAIAGTPQNRPKMAAGENCVYHPPTGSIIHFKQNGDINITTETNVNVDAPNATFTGNVTINGNLTVGGDTTLTDTVTSNGKDISDTHAHSGVQSGGSNTGPVV